MNAEFPRLSTSIGGRKGKCSNRRAEREQKMNLIREVLSDQTVTAVASIILIVAALPMAGWSWAVNQMAGKSAGRKRRVHESASVVPVQWSVSVVQELLGLQ